MDGAEFTCLGHFVDYFACKHYGKRVVGFADSIIPGFLLLGLFLHLRSSFLPALLLTVETCGVEKKLIKLGILQDDSKLLHLELSISEDIIINDEKEDDDEEEEEEVEYRSVLQIGH